MLFTFALASCASFSDRQFDVNDSSFRVAHYTVKRVGDILSEDLKTSRETKFVYFLDEDYDLVEGKWSIENFFGEKRFYQTYIITYQSVPDETLLVVH